MEPLHREQSARQQSLWSRWTHPRPGMDGPRKMILQWWKQTVYIAVMAKEAGEDMKVQEKGKDRMSKRIEELKGQDEDVR